MFNKIKRFLAGNSSRTAFSAGAMNEIVDGLNQLLGTRAGKGIVIDRADAGWVISWDPNAPGEGAILGEGGGSNGTVSGIAFRGAWSGAVTDYVAGNVVIKTLDPGDFTNQSAGTYVAFGAVPAGIEPGVSTGWGAYWALFAKGFWDHIVIGGVDYTDIAESKISGYRDTSTAPSHSGIAATIASGSLPRAFEWDGGFGYVSHYSGYGVKPYLFIVRVDPNVAIPALAETDRAVVLDLSACQYTDTSAVVHPRLLKVREIDICDSGVAKKMLVLASAPYTLAP